jgi:hypothetical protein
MDDGSDEDESNESASATIVRKIDSVTWKKGRGNSYVVNAFDVGRDGKLDRLKLTEYKIDNSLIDLIKDATSRGRNPGITFIESGVLGAVAQPVVPEAHPAGPPENEGRAQAADEDEEE